MAVPTFAELKVLIIDDAPIVIASLRSMLLKLGFLNPILCGVKAHEPRYSWPEGRDLIFLFAITTSVRG